MLQAAFKYTTYEAEEGMVHSVFSALAEHPVTRYAKFIYFPGRW